MNHDGDEYTNMLIWSVLIYLCSLWHLYLQSYHVNYTISFQHIPTKSSFENCRWVMRVFFPGVGSVSLIPEMLLSLCEQWNTSVVYPREPCNPIEIWLSCWMGDSEAAANFTHQYEDFHQQKPWMLHQEWSNRSFLGAFQGNIQRHPVQFAKERYWSVRRVYSMPIDSSPWRCSKV